MKLTSQSKNNLSLKIRIKHHSFQRINILLYSSLNGALVHHRDLDLFQFLSLLFVNGEII